MDDNTQDIQRETGTINWFNTTKGYGFISPDQEGGEDVFVHITDLGQGVDPNQLTDGVRVEYSLAEGPKGKNAVEVTIIE